MTSIKLMVWANTPISSGAGSPQFGNQYLVAFELGGQSPVEWAGQPAGIELSGVEQHVTALLVNSRYYIYQVRLTD